MKSSFSTDGREAPPEQILVGVVLAAHGLRGEVRVAVHSDVPARFVAGATILAAAPDRSGSSFKPRPLRIARVSPHKGGLRIAFEGVADRDAARALAGLELTVPRHTVPAAAPGSYYQFDLVGCRCFDERSGELGTVVEIVADGGGWLLEVELDEDGAVRRLSLPFVEEFLVRVDPNARRIDWRLPEGLVESCASRS